MGSLVSSQASQASETTKALEHKGKMNYTDLLRDAEPPADLSPAAAEVWRTLQREIVIDIGDGSPLAARVAEDPAAFERALLAGFARVAIVIAACRASVAAGLGLPPLSAPDTELLRMFGLTPRWALH